jgi:hypothetical protein
VCGNMGVAVKLGHIAMWGWLLSQGMQRYGSSYQVSACSDMAMAIELGHAATWQQLSSQGTQ